MRVRVFDCQRGRCCSNDERTQIYCFFRVYSTPAPKAAVALIHMFEHTRSRKSPHHPRNGLERSVEIHLDSIANEMSEEVYFMMPPKQSGSMTLQVLGISITSSFDPKRCRRHQFGHCTPQGGSDRHSICKVNHPTAGRYERKSRLPGRLSRLSRANWTGLTAHIMCAHSDYLGRWQPPHHPTTPMEYWAAVLRVYATPTVGLTLMGDSW